MANTEFTQLDLDNLGVKLAALDLTPGEQAALGALIAIASDAIAKSNAEQARSAGPPAAVVEHDDELPTVREQLSTAFQPGEPAATSIRRITWSSVGGGTIALTPPTVPPPEE